MFEFLKRKKPSTVTLIGPNGKPHVLTVGRGVEFTVNLGSTEKDGSSIDVQAVVRVGVLDIS